KIMPNLIRQDIRLLNPVRDLAPPAGTGNVYELRWYRCRPGTAKTWLKHFTEALPVREKYSKIVGLWSTEAGQPNEVMHLWSYPDLNTRTTARNAVAKDPGWQEFLAKAGGHLDELENMVMLPAAHSPMK